MTGWQLVHDSREAKPEAIDTASSMTTVYERRNIRQETRHDEMADMDITEWLYEQRTYTRDEYAALTGPQTQTIMQAVNEQAATTVTAMLSDTATLDAIMQAINQQTADIAAMTMGG